MFSLNSFDFVNVNLVLTESFAVQAAILFEQEQNWLDFQNEKNVDSIELIGQILTAKLVYLNQKGLTSV